MMKVVKREAVFIPIKDLTKSEAEAIKAKLHFAFYEDKACSKCEWLEERHNDVCDNCAAFKGSFDLASKVKIKDNSYLKIPVGSYKSVLRKHEYELVDKAKDRKIRKIEFTGTLKATQEAAVQDAIKKMRGVLEAPPRSGKTVIGTAMTCRLGVKTLILGAQKDWLEGFRETFVGSGTQKPLTDLNMKRIGFCKTLKDFETYDVCLATVQSLYSESGIKVLAQIRDMFSLIIIDEVHTAAASKFASIVSKLNAKYMLGLSGTPDRKDGKYVLVQNIVGPVLHEMEAQAMSPLVATIKTKFKKSYKGRPPWASMVSSLENDKARLELIANEAIADIKKGHLVLIPFAQKKAIAKTIDLINKKAGEVVAVEFTGSTAKKRPQLVQDARDYKVKVVVGTLKILSVGINIPRASMLYEVTMSSNLPNAKQRMMRVLTAHEGKPQPTIKFFLDDSDVRKNCMRNEYFGVLTKMLKPLIDEKTKEIMKTYFSKKASFEFDGDL